MTKIIFSALFPLLQIYLVTVPLKVIDFFFNYFMSSSSFSGKGKPKFLGYLKLQNVSLNTVKLLFGNMLSSHYRDHTSEIYSSQVCFIPELFKQKEKTMH